MKILKEYDLKAPILASEGSTLSVKYNNERVASYPIESDLIVNHVKIIEVQDEFGFKVGLGAIVGEKK